MRDFCGLGQITIELRVQVQERLAQRQQTANPHLRVPGGTDAQPSSAAASLM